MVINNGIIINYGIYLLQTGGAGQHTRTTFPLAYTTINYAPVINTFGALGPGSYGAGKSNNTQFLSTFVRQDSYSTKVTAQFICIGY